MDLLRCLSTETGHEHWSRGYLIGMKRNHGKSRSIPAVSEKSVVTIGPRCQVMCVDPLSGELLWGIDMANRYGTEEPEWYSAQCPLIHRNAVILAPAGDDVLITAIDQVTGDTLWETKNPLGIKMSHSSVMLIRLAGKLTYVYAGIGGITGISAEVDDWGVELWATAEWTPAVIAPSPLALDSNRFLITAGYGAGSAVFQIVRTVEKGLPEKYVAELSVRYKPYQGIASEQQTPVLWKDLVFSIQPQDAGELRGQLVCWSVTDLQKPLWSSGVERQFGLGPYMLVQTENEENGELSPVPVLLVLGDDGMLTRIEVSRYEYLETGHFAAVTGSDPWGPMAAAQGVLYLRDFTALYSFDFSKKGR